MGSEGDTIVNVGSLGYQLAEANLDDINFQVRFPVFSNSSPSMWLIIGNLRMARFTTAGKLMGKRRRH
jgi:hypothetical protein